VSDESAGGTDSGASLPATKRAGRRFGDDEISRILQTAADLQERAHGVGYEAGRGLTLEDLRQVAEEAGIDPRFIDLAASNVDAPVERRENRLAGGAHAWHFRTTVPGEIGDSDRDRILHGIRSVMGQKGELADVYGRMEWSYDDGVGPVILGISSRDGKTEIDVSAVKTNEASAVHAMGIPFGGVFGGAAVAGAVGLSGLTALPVIAAAGVVAYGATRFGWKLRSQWWERRLRRVVERISSIAQEVAVLPPGDAAED